MGRKDIITKEYMEEKANAAFATVDRKAVRVMEEMTGMKIEKEARGEKVNVCKGIQREQKLTRYLLRDNRLDDLKRALDDPAFRQKLCEEYEIDSKDRT